MQKLNMRHSPLGVSALCCLLVILATPAPAGELRWYKGSTHIHTANPFDRYAPESVADWYRTHGYDFIVVTEHEKVIDTRSLGSAGFLVMPGQEITQVVRDESHPDGIRHTHVNGLGIHTAIMPIRMPGRPPRDVMPNQLTPEEYREFAQQTAGRITAAQSYQRNIAEIRKQGGIAQVNHPNLNWSVRPQDLLSLEGPFLLEIANGFPFANDLGGVSDSGEVALSTEAFWDVLLSAGKVAWGVASDDAHDYTHFDRKNVMTPGKGWIVVRAADLAAESVAQALRSGDFYASTGIRLKDVRTERKRLSIEIEHVPGVVPHMAQSTRFKTTFIGKDGRILKEAHGMSVSYEFRGDEGYVRAAIIDSDGRKAWTQPVFLDGRGAVMESS